MKIIEQGLKVEIWWPYFLQNISFASLYLKEGFDQKNAVFHQIVLSLGLAMTNNI